MSSCYQQITTVATSDRVIIMSVSCHHHVMIRSSSCDHHGIMYSACLLMVIIMSSCYQHAILMVIITSI
eukprot:2382629-Amphidinium_carterae.1